MTDFVNTKAKAFGWVIHRKLIAPGETYRASVLEDTLPKDSENITLWTKGHLVGTREDGYIPPPRRAGDFSLERQMMPKGIYTFTAQEASEWWCINWRANRHSLPVVLPLRLAPGEQRALRASTLLLVCSGSLETQAGEFGPGTEVMVGAAGATVRASRAGPVFGLFFDKERS